MQIAQFVIRFNWKGFKIDLPSFELKMRGIAGLSYVGNSADSEFLNLWFLEEPSENINAMITQAWEQLDEQAESDKISYSKNLKTVIEHVVSNLPMKDWNSMIPAERKLVLNQGLNEADKSALMEKYRS